MVWPGCEHYCLMTLVLLVALQSILELHNPGRDLMDLVKGVAGVAISIAIGGTIYTVNQADVVDNFADDTGLTQQQAQEYVESVGEEDLVSYTEVGATYTASSTDSYAAAEQIDCVNYEYEWESASLTCELGKSQLSKIGDDELALAQAFKRLDSSSATDIDIRETIRLLSRLNVDYDFEIAAVAWGDAIIDEAKKTNSYNKALLEAALESQ